jgi:glycosyltransferase 2 family protein
VKIPRLTSRHALLIVQLIFTVALTAWLLHDFNWGSFLELFRSLPVWFYAGSFILFLIGQVVFTTKWTLILRHVGLNVPLTRSLAHYLISLYFNNFMVTAIGGDWARVYYLGREEGYNKVLASVFADRFLGFFTMTAAATALSWMIEISTPEYQFVRWGLVAFLLAFVVALVTILFFPVERLLKRVAGWIPRLQRFEARILRLVDNIRLACSSVRVTGSVMLLVITYYTLLAVIYIGFFYFAAGAQAHLFPTLLAVITIGILSNIPLTINGIGMRERLHVMFFASLNFSKELSVSIAILIFSYMLILSLVGYILWVRLQITQRQAALSAPGTNNV